MLILPVTRTDPIHVQRVVDAFDISDIPKHVFLYMDAPDTEIWYFEFHKRGWDIEYGYGETTKPPTVREERWHRHYLMRSRLHKIMQLPKYHTEYILLSEDDTIVPPHIWGDLKAAYEGQDPEDDHKNLMTLAVTGVQRSRHAGNYIGVMYYDEDVDCYDPMNIGLNSGIVNCDSCGLYALFTTPADMKDFEIKWSEYEPIDRIITRQFDNLYCDTGVWCGHLLENGTEIL